MTPAAYAVLKIWEISVNFVYCKYTNRWEIPAETCISDTRDRGFESHDQSENEPMGPYCFDP